MKRLAFALLLLALSAPQSPAQCWGGSCGGPVRVAPPAYFPPYLPNVQPPAPASVYRWVPIPGCDTQIALYRDGVQIGIWQFDPPAYYPRLTLADGREDWGSQRPIPGDLEPPAPPHCRGPAPADWQRRGVDRSKVGTHGERLRLSCPGGCDDCNGCPACGEGGACPCDHTPRAGGKGAEGDGKIPDYNALPSLTVVCADPAKRERVLNDLQTAPALATYRDKFAARARGYAPDHWHLAPFKLAEDQRFKQSGFAVYVQGLPDAKGKARTVALYDYAGPEQLAGVLREPSPDYDPNKTPAAGGSVSGDLLGAGGFAGLLAAIAAAVRYLKG